MPQPTPGDVHVDQLLTNLSVAYAQRAPFIADVVFSPFPVAHQSNRYRTYPRRAWFRTVAGKRAPATESRGTGWTYSTESYFADVWAVHHDIDDQTLANADPGLNLDAESVTFVTNQLLLRRDQEWADRYFQTGVWGIDMTGVAAAPAANQFIHWDDGASTPIQDIQYVALDMERKTGYRPNVLVVTPDLEPVLLNHPQILERIKYTQPGFISWELLASVFGVQRIVVARTVVDNSVETEAEYLNTANAADLTTNFTYMFDGGQALLAYSAPSMGIRTVTAGTIFTWTGLMGAGAFGGRIKRFRMEEKSADRVEIEAAWDMKVISPDLGVFWDNILTP